MLLLVLLDDSLICFFKVLCQNNVAVLTDGQHSTLLRDENENLLPSPSDGGGRDLAPSPREAMWDMRGAAEWSQRGRVFMHPLPGSREKPSLTHLLTDGVDISS